MKGTSVKDDRNVLDVFVIGAKKGWDLGVGNIIPNVLMAFVGIQILQVTGLLTLLGDFFAPVMAVFGLPGQAVVVLFSSMMSMGGGVGVAAGLYTNNVLDATSLTIVFPAIFLLGAKIQYVGRLLGTIGIPAKYFAGLLGLSVINAFISMFIMKILVMF